MAENEFEKLVQTPAVLRARRDKQQLLLVGKRNGFSTARDICGCAS